MQGSLQTSSAKSASSASPTLCLQTWSVCLQYPRQQTLTCYQTLLSSVSQLHCRSDRTVVGWWYLWYGCWGLGSMPALPASWVGSSEAACTFPLPEKKLASEGICRLLAVGTVTRRAVPRLSQNWVLQLCAVCCSNGWWEGSAASHSMSAKF